MLKDPSVNATTAVAGASTHVAIDAHPKHPIAPHIMRYDFRLYPKIGTESLKKPHNGFTNHGACEMDKINAVSLGLKCSSSFK